MSHEHERLLFGTSTSHRRLYQRGDVSCSQSSLSLVGPPPLPLLSSHHYLCYYLKRLGCSDYRVLCWSF